MLELIHTSPFYEIAALLALGLAQSHAQIDLRNRTQRPEFANDMSEAEMNRNLERESQARQRDMRRLGDQLRARIGDEG